MNSLIKRVDGKNGISSEFRDAKKSPTQEARVSPRGKVIAKLIAELIGKKLQQMRKRTGR
jgi:hypothetical protein